MRRYFPGLNDFFVLLVTYFLLVNQLGTFANDPGLGWHLQTGNEILKNWAIPTIDPFLYSATPRNWVADQWLSDLLLAGGFSMGGFSLLYTGFILLYLILFTGILYGSLRALRTHPIAASITSLLAFKMSLVHFILRPTVFGITLFCFCTIWLQQLSKQTEIKRKDFLVGFTLFFLWANLHPSFPLGIFLVGILLLHSSCNREIELRSSNLLLLLATAILATFLNPYGYHLHQSILSLVGNEYFMSLNEEWLPIDLTSSEGLYFSVAIALFLAFCIRHMASGALTKHLFSIVTTLFFIVMTLKSVRYLPYFTLISAFPIANFLTDTIEYLKAKLPRPFSFPLRSLVTHEEQLRYGGYFGLSLAVFMLLVSHLFIGTLPFQDDIALGPNRDYYPIREIEMMKTKAANNGKRYVIAASPNYGGLITFYGYPHLQAVIDDRNTLLGESFYRDFFSAFSEPENLTYLKKLGATHQLQMKEENNKKRYVISSLNGPFSDS